jgi:aryl-alcohol dehydrogenase-like predicted oxidoreductase
MPMPAGAGASPAYVATACEQSLSRLGTDYIDLYQLHAPDPTVPFADTLGALASLVDAGKVRAIGCSNLSADQLRDARAAAGVGPAFVSVQNQFSLLYRAPETDGVLAECERQQMGFLPYYPLANGLLTGKYRPGEPVPEGTRLSLMPPERSAHWLSDTLMSTVGGLIQYASETGESLLDLAISWLLDHGRVASVIAGVSTPAQAAANASAPRKLSPEVVDRLNELTA